MISNLNIIFNKILETPFEKELANTSLAQLNDKHNKLRLNNFAYSLRELSRHVLKRMAPDENVRETVWFKPENKDNPKKITRGQRMKYAIQRSLSDEFVEEVLDLDLSEVIQSLKDSIDTLSKYTHINEDTFDCDDVEVADISEKVAKSFIDFFDEMTRCRNNIVNELEDSINEELVQTIFSETINEIDCLATHHEIEEVSISSIKLSRFGSDSCEFDVKGNVSVRLQYGSDGDMKRDDGFEIYKGFPFNATLTTTLENGEIHYGLEVEDFSVDTESFWE